MSLFNELKQRNVFRVGIAYIVTAWVIIQVVETLFPIFDIGSEFIRIVVLILAIGFVPVLFLAWAFELTPEGLKREADVDRSQSKPSGTGKKLDRWAIAMLALALAYFVFDKFILDPARDADLVNTTAEMTEQAVMNRTPEKSIAVLPFVNMSVDPEQEFFSDGISEEILNALTKVDAFKVTGRTSSFAFKGKNEDLRSIGKALNVAHVLEGSVRKSGNRLRITAQLIKVDDGYHLWSETYDRNLTDVFAIQDEIADAILEQLKVHMLGGEMALVESTRTDAEAYELYLQARQLIYERRTPSIELAAELLDKAIAIDPVYAPAYAQRGIVWNMLSAGKYGRIPEDEALRQSRSYLDKALELDSELAEAWAGLGAWYAFKTSSEPERAIEALEKALSINPYMLDAMNWLQGMLSLSGDLDGALVILEKIRERDPFYLSAIWNAVGIYNDKREFAESLALLERVKNDFTDQQEFIGIEGEIYFKQGQYARAQQLIEQTDPRQQMNRRFWLPYIWNETHQFERSVDDTDFEPLAKSIALWHLGRLEEATSLALKHTSPETAEGYVFFQPYFQILNASDNSQELIDFVEARWTLDEFEEQLNFDRSIMGYAPLNEIALAYIRTGEHQKAEDVLARVKAGQENPVPPLRWMQYSLNRAVYFSLKGDFEAALEHLEDAIDEGYIGPTRLATLWPAFEPLEGDPRYEEIQSRMIKHLNNERRALGLEPIKA